MSTKNLFDFDRAQLTAFFSKMGEPSFRTQQVMKWLYHERAHQFQAMSNLSKVLRSKLEEQAELTLPKVIFQQGAKDETHKWVLGLEDKNSIETVYIPDGRRGTLCVSSQVGCTLNCSFCSTGKQGFNRNLTTAEIIGQVVVAEQALAKEGRAITNVVMMGMGEPLYNYDNVVAAMDIMMDDLGFGLSKKKVTLSTAGVVPKMLELKARSDAALAVSLHATNDDLRNELVPINRKYPLKELLAVCRDYFPKGSRRSITFEYVMLEGVNDSLADAKALVKCLEGIPNKVNLIPFNPFPHTQYKRSSDAVISKFQDYLYKAGLRTLIRRTRGDDIDAACGQLVGQVQDKTRRSERYLKSLGEAEAVQ